MITRYLVTLAIAVFIVTVAASRLQFATRSQVLSGDSIDETFQLEFTMDADGTHSYEITPAIQHFLQSHSKLRTQGTAEILADNVAMTPKDVSWTENRRTITAPGAALSAQLRWVTPKDSPNGARSDIYLDFPVIPGLPGEMPTFHSGGYQKTEQGRYVLREVTTWQNGLLLSLSRFLIALSAGLPFGIVVHTIYWAFVLNAEKKLRVSAFPPRGTGFPQTFHPNPISEWIVWLFVLGIGAAIASLISGLSAADGFMSSSIRLILYTIVAVVAAIAFLAAYFTGKHQLTVRVDQGGISYARGRADLQWLTARWNEITRLTQKTRTSRNSTIHWIELEFNDNRKTLRIGQSIEGYTVLRDLLFSTPKADRANS